MLSFRKVTPSRASLWNILWNIRKIVLVLKYIVQMIGTKSRFVWICFYSRLSVCCEAPDERNMLKKLSNIFISKFKLTTHGITTSSKKKDIDSEETKDKDMRNSVSERARKQQRSFCPTNLSGGQKISIPITRRDHYAILDFSHNSKKHKKYWKMKYKNFPINNDFYFSN